LKNKAQAAINLWKELIKGLFIGANMSDGGWSGV
jgi:hypothetical protein